MIAGVGDSAIPRLLRSRFICGPDLGVAIGALWFVTYRVLRVRTLPATPRVLSTVGVHSLRLLPGLDLVAVVLVAAIGAFLIGRSGVLRRGLWAMSTALGLVFSFLYIPSLVLGGRLPTMLGEISGTGDDIQHCMLFMVLILWSVVAVLRVMRVVSNRD